MNLVFYRSWSQRRRRWALGLVLAFVLYSVFGFFILPLIIKSQLQKQLSAATKRATTVKQVRFNPWALSLTVRGLSLNEPNGAVFASWDEFYVNFQASSLFRWAYTFKEIRLDRPYGEIVLRKDGTLNFSNITSSAPAAEPRKTSAPSSLPRFRVDRLTITNGYFAFEDQTRSKPFRTHYQPINVRLTDLTSRPGAMAPYAFKAENATGNVLSWSGDITAQPFKSQGHIEVQGVDPKKYQPYLDDVTGAEVVEGKASTALDYFLSSDTNGLDLVVSNATVELHGLKLRDPRNAEIVFSLPAFSVDHAGLSLRERLAKAGEVRVSDAEVVARLSEGGQLNLLELLNLGRPGEPVRTNLPAQSGNSWVVEIDHCLVTNAAVAFEDHSRKSEFKTRLNPINLDVTGFSTRTNSSGHAVLSVATEVSESVGATATFSVNPIQSAGQFRIKDLELPKYKPYLDPFLKGSIADGKFELGVDYRLSLQGTNLEAAISNALVRLTNLEVQGADTNEAVAKIPELAVEQAEASLGARSARVGLVTTRGGTIVVRRNADLSLNLLKLIPPSPGGGGDAQGAAAPKPGEPLAWSAKLDEFRISDYSVFAEDLALPQPVRLHLHDLNLVVKGAGSDLASPVSAEFSTAVAETGRIALKGSGRIAPTTADVELEIKDVDLRPLQPYLQQQANLGISSALFGMRGKASYTPDASPKARFQGSLGLSKFLSTDLVVFHQFVKWDDFQIGGINFQWQPDQLEIDEVKWDGLGITILINTNKQLNLAAVLPPPSNPPPANTPPPPQSEAKKTAPLPFNVHTFALNAAAFQFSDQSLQPHCQFDIQQLSGTVKGISSQPGSPAEVDLKGKFDEQSAFAIQGVIRPLADRLGFNLSFSNQNMQLPVFTPYAEKFAGHPLNKGRLSMSLHYDLEQGQVKAENKFRIDQLMLGPRNNSPDATSLPVKLGIALLKDSDGRIELDVPVTGRLDDPQFRIAPIIWKVVLNMITKAATSPFKLLGALVGAGEELAYLEFTPGTSELMQGETNKLAKLVKALEQRPALNLEIEAMADPQADREAFARQEIRQRLRLERLKELSAGGQTPENPQGFQVDDATYERLLRTALVGRFGTNLSSALQAFAASSGTNSHASAGALVRPASSSKKPGLLARAWSYVPFVSRKNPIAQERHRAKADAQLLQQSPELAAVGAAQMEGLLASEVVIPAEKFRELMQARAKFVEAEFLKTGLTAERLFLVAPKPIDTISSGQPRVNLSLN